MIIEKKIHRGDTFTEIWTFRDKATKEPIDLSLYAKIVADIREGINQNSYRIKRLSTLNSEMVISGDNNEILTISMDTSNWDKSKYYMDVRVLEESGDVATYVALHITVLNVVTKIEEDE